MANKATIATNVATATGIGFILVWFGIVGAAVIGYIMNILNIINIEAPIDATEILQILGVFLVPLGSIMGWLI